MTSVDFIVECPIEADAATITRTWQLSVDSSSSKVACGACLLVIDPLNSVME